MVEKCVDYQTAMGSMRGLRHNWLVSRLALFALALQLILSFGHTHHDLMMHPHASWSLVGCHVNEQSKCNSSPHDEGHDSCVICFALALLETAVASAPPTLVRVVDLVGSPMPVMLDATRHLQTAFMFQARGPPQAV